MSRRERPARGVGRGAVADVREVGEGRWREGREPARGNCEDSERAPEPWAVLTGDSLFVGDVARPDLAVEKEEGAREMFHSLHERLLSLPDDYAVFSGHGPATTIGRERKVNPFLNA